MGTRPNSGQDQKDRQVTALPPFPPLAPVPVPRARHARCSLNEPQLALWVGSGEHRASSTLSLCNWCHLAEVLSPAFSVLQATMFDSVSHTGIPLSRFLHALSSFLPFSHSFSLAPADYCPLPHMCPLLHTLLYPPNLRDALLDPSSEADSTLLSSGCFFHLARVL